MRRRLLNILTALSLVLCVAAGVLWVRSHYTGDTLTLGTFDSSAGGGDAHYFEFRSHRGWFEFTEPGGWPRWYWKRPYWPFAAWTAAPPALWGAVRAGLAVRARRRGVAGRCRACGYDLRATPDRCPECGTRREATP